MNNARINRVIENMRAQSMPQLVVSSLESIYYLSGIWCPMGERLQALHITEGGQVTLIANRMFALSGRQGTAALVEYGDEDDSVNVLSSVVKPGALGIEKTWPSHFLIRLMAQRPDVIPVLGSKPVDDARMLKDADEIAAMLKSSRVNDAVVGFISGSLTASDTELAVARRYDERAIALGSSGHSFTPLICFGANAAEPHHGTDNTAIKPGDAVILDLGLDLDHAMSDMTRTVFYKSATDEQKRVYDIVLEANMAAKRAVRPGVALSSVDRAARGQIESHGYGANFLHRTGHGIGIEVHEPPDVSSVSPVIAQPGMVFSIEPGIYLPGKFGVRIEDLVLVTEDGCKVLNELDLGLKIVE